MFRMIRRIFMCGVIVGALTPLCIRVAGHLYHLIGRSP